MGFVNTIRKRFSNDGVGNNSMPMGSVDIGGSRGTIKGASSVTFSRGLTREELGKVGNDLYNFSTSYLSKYVVDIISGYFSGSGIEVVCGADSETERANDLIDSYNIRIMLKEAMKYSMCSGAGALVYMHGGKDLKKMPKDDLLSLMIVDKKDYDITQSVENILHSTFGDVQYTLKKDFTKLGGDVVPIVDRFYLLNAYPMTNSDYKSFFHILMRYARALEDMYEGSAVFLQGAQGIQMTDAMLDGNDLTAGEYENRLTENKKVLEALRKGEGAVTDSNVSVRTVGADTGSVGGAMSDDFLKAIFSAVSSLPQSLLFGEDKGGMNTGASKSEDARNTIRDIKSMQERWAVPFVAYFLKNFEITDIKEIKILDNYSISEDEEAQRVIDWNASVVDTLETGAIEIDEARNNLKGLEIDTDRTVTLEKEVQGFGN